MEQIIVKRLNGTTFKLQSKQNVSSITRASQSVEMLGQDVVDISIQSAKKMVFSLGDKITIVGRDYTLNTPATERKISESHFTYDLQFEGVQYDMLRAAYSVNVDTTSNEIQDINGDSLTGDLKLFLDVLISNMNRVFPAKWVLGTCPLTSETRTETFSDTDNCLTVLQSLCSEDKYNTEFKIDIAENGTRTLNVGAFGNTMAYTFEYGKGKGIYELTRQKTSSSNIVTRLNVFGSSKNIMTSKYRAFKLCLPTKSKSQSYLENATAIAKYGVWEGTKNFEDIFPHRKGTVSALGSNELKFTDNTMDFDLNAKDGNGNTLYLMAGTSAKIHFNTGNLAGYEFELTSYNHATKEFEILPQTDENGYTFPSPTSAAFQFSANDEYTITDIYMPQSYVDAAEAKLATAGADYLTKYSQPLVSYGLTIDSFFLRDIIGMEVDSNLIWAGDYIPVKDTDLEIDKTIRVKGFVRDLMQDMSYNITVADLPITVSTISRIVTEINQVDKVIKYNNLNDPARARRNYKATAELATMIDTVQAEAALIGNNPASQYDLTDVAITANYNKNANVINFSAGTIQHNYYPVGDPGTWSISAGNFAGLTPATPYYVYIKASKSAATAVFFLSSTKIAVEEALDFYNFPLGLLSSVIDGARVFSSTKGYTLITGDSIKTGRISSNDGTRYFDLTTGEFRGDFKFTSGTSVEAAIGTAQSNAISTAAGDATNKVNAVQVGGRNLLLNTNLTTIYETNRVSSVGYTDTLTLDVANLDSLQYTLSFFAESNNAAQIFSCFFYNPNNTTNAITSQGVASTAIDGFVNLVGDNTMKRYFITWTQATGVATKKIIIGRVQGVGHIKISGIKFEKGNKATDWTPAPEDVEADATAKASAAQTAAQNYAAAQAALAEITAKAHADGIVDAEEARAIADATAKAEAARVAAVNAAAADATNKANVVRQLALAVQGGKMLYRDPNFASGLNGVNSYNNNAGTALGLTRELKQLDSPSTSGYELKLSYIGGSLGTSPGLGGFQFNHQSRANAIFALKFTAKIPVGYSFEYAANAAGDGASAEFVTSTAGTGRYTEYIVMINCGTSGTFSTVGFIYLVGASTPLNWYVSYATMVDLTDTDIYQIDSTDYLKSALQGSTDISGGILATNVLLMKTLAGLITGGMSGLANDNVGVWTGGTYQQALSSLAKVILRKDGSGQLAGGKIFWDLLGALNVGNFEIINGNIVGRDANGIEKLKLSIEDIPTIESMNSTYVVVSSGLQGNGYFTVESLWDEEFQEWYNQISYGVNYFDINVQVVVPYATYIKVNGGTVTLDTQTNGEIISSGTNQTVYIRNSGGTLIASGNTTQEFQVTQAGTYSVQIRTYANVEVSEGGWYADAWFGTTNASVSYVESVEKTALGKDGVFSYFSSSEFFHFKRGQGFKAKGGFDVPGVLAAGSVSSGGTISKQYGAKFHYIEKAGTGAYRIYHTIGHTNYSVQLTPQTSARLAYVSSSKQSNYALVYMTNTSGTNIDTAFDFLIIGAN